MTDFICPDCEHTWSLEPDTDGLFKGYGRPPCPLCGTNGCDPSNYQDYWCRGCGKRWRQYGNGGLVLGMVPNCPNCGGMVDFV